MFDDMRLRVTQLYVFHPDSPLDIIPDAVQAPSPRTSSPPPLYFHFYRLPSCVVFVLSSSSFLNDAEWRSCLKYDAVDVA